MIKKIQAALLFPVVPNYWVRFLRHLSMISTIDVTCFHGKSSKGFGVHSAGTSLPVKNIWVKNYFYPMGRHRVFWQSSLMLLFKGNFDVIVCQEVVHNLAIWAIWLLGRLYKKRLILFGYGYRPANLPRPFWIMRNFIRKLLLKNADAVIVYTRQGSDECIRIGMHSKKIFIMNNTLDTEYLMSLQDKIAEEELKEIRDRLKLSSSHTLLYVGRLLPEKRIDILIESFSMLKQSNVDISLLVVGEGTERQRLLQQAKSLENIHFVGPIYDDRKLAKFFTISDLLVIPGRVGLTCVHGFCYGVPIVTTKHGVEQSPEVAYITHKKNGYVVNTLDAKCFTEAILYIINNLNEFNYMQAGARQTAKSLKIEAMVAQFAAAIEYAAQDNTRL
ncbi:MAG: glycosyltransferase family 4 protein [Candidatus Omnitrophica bacterium]|nr:glycosyltransferase family 4 protein [Candidatus Omnitrophota bacterium]